MCRCWRGKRVCVSLVMAVFWLFVLSFVGCCPDRKADYFVYAELIMSEQSAPCASKPSPRPVCITLFFFFFGHALSQICISR